ncbi:OLC1v1019221C1 [Oldenlandia corymbosa var. corymbosa]|uniref:OLC1v1019221C1 n=1 Tax=Oldenlandia corymbosa var. corymbosa TaxID=529605 RepID=A0AAV1EDJ0_OLDCO|nr:OLC1v1019221C1 [Oldenlandia corymbosa var. corymbosa]
MDESKVDMFSLHEKIDKVREDIRELYVPILSPLDFKFPTTNVMGFINFLLENLKEMMKCNHNRISFTKHEVMIVYEEVSSLKPHLEIIMELQKERRDLKELCKQIINMMLLTDHVISSCLTLDNPIWYDMLRLSDVLQAVRLLQNEVKKYNIQLPNTEMSRNGTDSSFIPTSQANLSNHQDVVVGREDESEMKIEKLTRGTKQLQIVSIVGMPGLGKSALVQKLYNDPSIRSYFHKRAWFCVSQKCNHWQLYFEILTQISSEDLQSDSNNSGYDLAEKIRKNLKGRRYLIVLDDIWDIGAWKSIKFTFPNDNNGSRIIFTSRITNLWSQPNPMNCIIHPLQPLSDEQSWELLKMKLSHQQISLLDDELSKIGEMIAKNTEGLPLAVVLIAGTLEGQDREFWKQIEFRSSIQVVSERCMDALELSYKHLPDNLKPCFLYFDAFQRAKVVKAQYLMSLWIAEGLIPRNDEKSSYELAEAYLYDLINRNLVTLAKRSSIGGVKECCVHDLLHELCSEKVREENFLQCVNGREISHSSLNTIKYANYRLCIHEWTNFVDAKPSGSFVRSLGYFGWWIEWNHSLTFLNRFRLLNVLNLESIIIHGPFPPEVTLIVHLRHLEIGCEATELPESIVNLWNLRTLRLPESKIVLPEFFWQMKSLSHLHVGKLYLNGLEDHEYGQLEHLEILSKPILDLEDEITELLRRLPGIRKLKFELLDIVSSEFPELSLLTHLESVSVFGSDEVRYGKKRYRFPAFDFPSSLKKLTLEEMGMEWSFISIIGQLPNLEVLKLRHKAFSGSRWDVEDGEFLTLKYLELSFLGLEEWTVEDEPFPKLEQLKVTHCFALRGIPTSLGDIPTLKKIDMSWCPLAFPSATEILEEQREMGNDELEVYNDFPSEIRSFVDGCKAVCDACGACADGCGAFCNGCGAFCGALKPLCDALRPLFCICDACGPFGFLLCCVCCLVCRPCVTILGKCFCLE